MKFKKSGQAPTKWSKKKRGRWQYLMFLWDDIQPKTKGELDTMVGISIQHMGYYVLQGCLTFWGANILGAWGFGKRVDANL